MSFEYKQLTTFGFTLTIWVGMGVSEMGPVNLSENHLLVMITDK